MKEPSRDRALASIRAHIEESGHHVYLVGAGQYPRFLYTIGLREKLGAELLLAGGTNYSGREAGEVVNVIAGRMPATGSPLPATMSLGDLGTFSFREVHSTWASPLMLGALDYFKVREIAARQIVPDPAHWTIDVPDTSVAWSARAEPVWRHMHEPWNHAFSREFSVTADLAALSGAPVTEVVRLRESQWEMFAGPEHARTSEETRTVTLATLVLADESLLPAVTLEPGAGLRRSSKDAAWRPWRPA